MSADLLFYHFDMLLDAPGSIPKLRQTILQLAVQGRLVPQDPADEPATVLLQQMMEGKSCLVRSGIAVAW